MRRITRLKNVVLYLQTDGFVYKKGNFCVHSVDVKVMGLARIAARIYYQVVRNRWMGRKRSEK
jgi:hypothetical protein